jgi:hypothetical protein
VKQTGTLTLSPIVLVRKAASHSLSRMVLFGRNFSFYRPFLLPDELKVVKQNRKAQLGRYLQIDSRAAQYDERKKVWTGYSPHALTSLGQLAHLLYTGSFPCDSLLELARAASLSGFPRACPRTCSASQNLFSASGTCSRSPCCPLLQLSSQSICNIYSLNLQNCGLASESV